MHFKYLFAFLLHHTIPTNWLSLLLFYFLVVSDSIRFHFHLIQRKKRNGLLAFDIQYFYRKINVHPFFLVNEILKNIMKNVRFIETLKMQNFFFFLNFFKVRNSNV